MKYKFFVLAIFLCLFFSCSDLFNKLAGSTEMSSSFLDDSGASYNASFDLSTGEFNVELSTTSDEETCVQSISISQEALNTLAQSLPVSKIKKINFSANVGGSTIITVGSYAFVNFPYLEEIVLPDNVSTINIYAFSGLTKVKTLTLPKYIQKICSGAFDQWTEHQTVILPTSGYVKEAFPGIYETSAKVYQKDGIKIDKSLLFFNYYTNNDDTEIFCSIDSSNKLKLEGTGGIQDSNYCRFIYAYQLNTEPIFKSTKSITVGSGITVIAPDLFKEMDNLETFTWNNTDDDAIILDSAFLTCPLLSSCTLPEGLTTIDKNVFVGCTNLGVVTPLVIPSTVTFIESTAFTGWTAAQKIKLNMTNAVAKDRFTIDTFGSATVWDIDESPITF